MSGVSYQGDRVLDIMSANAPNRNKAIEKLIRKYVFENLPANARVMEFGAGKGEFIYRFLNKSNAELLALETEKSYSEKLSEKVNVYHSLNEVPGQLDCIYLIDVLEHIEDDEEILRNMYEKLKENGRLFIYVPARIELFSEFDKKIGHYRRYSLRELKSKVKAAGFHTKKIRYHELLGYFASALNKITAKNGELNPHAVRLYDSTLVPVTNFFEQLIPPPIGKSIYLFAEKD